MIEKKREDQKLNVSAASAVLCAVLQRQTMMISQANNVYRVFIHSTRDSYSFIHHSGKASILV